MKSISRISSEGLRFMGPRSFLWHIRLIYPVILHFIPALFAAAQKGFSPLTHGSGYWDACLWRDPPLLNLWPVLPDVLVDLLCRLNKDGRKGKSTSCAPRAFSQCCFSDPSTPRCGCSRITRVCWKENAAPHSGWLNIPTFLTQIFGRDCRRDGTQSPLRMCFSKVGGDRCVRVASGWLCFTPPTDWRTAAPRGPDRHLVSFPKALAGDCICFIWT